MSRRNVAIPGLDIVDCICERSKLLLPLVKQPVNSWESSCTMKQCDLLCNIKDVLVGGSH